MSPKRFYRWACHRVTAPFKSSDVREKEAKPAARHTKDDTSKAAPEQANWLGANRIPNEIKLLILQHILTPGTLACLARAYPEWVEPLWNQYPNMLFRPALEHALGFVHTDLRADALVVYHLRRTRMEHVAAMGTREETQADADRLQAALRRILVLGREGTLGQETRPELRTVLDMTVVIGYIAGASKRYANDAWRRLHRIAAAVDERHNGARDMDNPPPVVLRGSERRSLYRGFLRAEIFLLTRAWTTPRPRRGRRYVFDMGEDIDHFLPGPDNTIHVKQFESCLRFIFAANRGHMREAARALGVGELPARDDLQWVPTKVEAKDYQRRYGEYGGRAGTAGDGQDHPGALGEFARRTVSDEQRFLLWMCEGGLEALQRLGSRDSAQRQQRLLRSFSLWRAAWDAVELRHRAHRYELWPDLQRALAQQLYPRRAYGPRRNRHPVMSLYPAGTRLQYPEAAAPWACAAAFLAWADVEEGPFPVTLGLIRRQGLTIGWRTRWVMDCDTDANRVANVPHVREDAEGVFHVPFGHMYMMDPEVYRLRLWNGLDADDGGP